VNRREGWTGYLFQGRFASYPMEDAHLIAAVRYVENNPVKAGLVPHAWEWHWSSARSHLAGKRVSGDPLTDVAAIGRHIGNWRSYLTTGAEAADDPLGDDIEGRLRTGRPLASPAWIAAAEAASGRKMAAQRRGRKSRSAP
jgi:putative transposase